MRAIQEGEREWVSDLSIGWARLRGMVVRDGAVVGGGDGAKRQHSNHGSWETELFGYGGHCESDESARQERHEAEPALGRRLIPSPSRLKIWILQRA